jgi:hypothetical protein
MTAAMTTATIPTIIPEIAPAERDNFLESPPEGLEGVPKPADELADDIAKADDAAREE